MEFLIWAILGCCFTGLGVFSFLSKKPVGFSAHTIFCHRSFVGSDRDDGGLYPDHRKEIPKKIIKV